VTPRDETRRAGPRRQDAPWTAARTAAAPAPAAELSDDELDAVVGGLARAWTEPPRRETGRDA